MLRQDFARMTYQRTLYVGTDHALYRARPGDDGRWRAEGLALAGLGGVRGLIIDPDDPRHWWACTGESGVLVTEDEGITWRDCNTGIDRRAGWCLVRDPRTGVLWYGAEPVALFTSADGGATWQRCEGIDGLLTQPEHTPPDAGDPGHVRHVAVSATGKVFAAVEEGWLLRSDDGGGAWVSVRDGVDRDCHSVTLLPGDPETVLVTTGGGICRSEDGGRSFAPSDDGVRQHYVADVVVHPDRPDVLFTAAAECDPRVSAQRPEGANGAFFRSDDGGRTWWRLTGGLPTVMRAAPTCVAGDPGSPDSFTVGTSDGSVWLSEDGGDSFQIAVEGIQGGVRRLLLTRR
jgi:photosystem II stability/assembly factor-like uncharacterized protein